ncbi:radical SAM protein [Flavobacterium sp.]|uniref:radical SAM protein n=1 Tax=Flavobacterium sp. TaxID=239 RepID=UPI003265CA58
MMDLPINASIHQTLSDTDKLIIDLEVTSRCNATCGFCPRSVMPDTKSYISINTVEKLAQNIMEGPQRHIVLCGIGESLLHPHIEQIIKILSDANAIVAMTSNGALMSGEKFRQLLNVGLKTINFSINAATASMHEAVMGMKNFDQVIANVENALEIKKNLNADVKINISFVACEQNIHETETFVKNWLNSSADQIWLHPINNRAGLLVPGMSPIKIDAFATNYLHDKRVIVDLFRYSTEMYSICKIAKNLAFISADGTMRLCAMDYQRITDYGNIINESLQQLQFEKLSGFLKGDYNKLCKDCDFCPSDLKNKLAHDSAEV